MQRREFIKLVGGAAAAWPIAAHAQQPPQVRRIGILMPYPKSDAESQSYVRAFRQELARLGWSAGGNFNSTSVGRRATWFWRGLMRRISSRWIRMTMLS